MTPAQFSFIECSYNPGDVTFECVSEKLCGYGFVKTNTNDTNTVSIWIQRLCVILLRESHDVKSFCISGLGFLADDHTIVETNAVYESEIGMYVCDDNCALRTLLVADHNDFSNFTYHIENMNTESPVSNPGIERVSGIVYECAKPETIAHYVLLGFEIQNESEDYCTLLSKNKRLTILCDKRKMINHINTVICETGDIFKTSAYIACNNLESKTYDLSYVTQEQFGEMTYKILGYNCLAHGNRNSYSIENLAKNVAPDLNVIFRMRSQHATINEEVFLKHFEDEL